MSVDYNKTLNLPKTEFPMRASLPDNEPTYLDKWERSKVYENLIDRNSNKPLYVLHDGPPYANGNIHIGTAVNKILKDFIVRYSNMAGFCSPYVPGWDMHGLPTERRALEELGVDDHEALSRIEIRRVCRDYAVEFVDIMTEQFKRLGVIGDWENPYKTIAKSYEATQIEVFGEMAKKGYIYKGLKSVYWCPECVTALAEAEIEYTNDEVSSIYVRFNAAKDNGVFEKLGVSIEKAYFVIWTTTAWTIPANVAVALHPDYDYDIVNAGGVYYVVARELRDAFLQIAEITDLSVLATLKGRDFEGILARHPYLDRDSLIINGEFVTLDEGTGAVHVAPGHGAEDFELVSERYPQLPVIVPVDNHGVMTAEAGRFSGLTTEQASAELCEYLTKTGHIIAKNTIVHQYPHCWRCKKPILFRATEQWFCSVEGFKAETIEAINRVKWTPAWGKERITSMVRDRKDWCISRQRSWGLPIPVFYCLSCQKYHISEGSIKAVAELFRNEGSDSWYLKEASDILPSGTACAECGGTHFSKETDIMDVWFDSGSSHLAILQEHQGLMWPYDVYLEGSDQYRGWFQSSLLTAVALKGEAPYKKVYSHGWVVDSEGRKQSKSLGNGVEPEEIIEKYGADILRLWVASVDYKVDMRISPDIIKQLSEAYRKVRNTARFILGNLGDFDPDVHSQAEPEELDRWALTRLDKLLNLCRAAYDNNEFHVVYHALHNFCVVDMSNFYLDVLKERLYIERADSATRRAAQHTIYTILTAITLLVSPILAFTSEEIWSYLPRSGAYDYDFVLYNEIPANSRMEFAGIDENKWDKILSLREDVKKALENARNEKMIGASLDAKVTIGASDERYAFICSVKDMLKSLFIVSNVEIYNDETLEGDSIAVTISKAPGVKCERCWSYSDSVGDAAKHPTLCARCVEIVESL